MLKNEQGENSGIGCFEKIDSLKTRIIRYLKIWSRNLVRLTHVLQEKKLIPWRPGLFLDQKCSRGFRGFEPQMFGVLSFEKLLHKTEKGDQD